MLNESYVSKIKTLPRDVIKVEVGYLSIFAPSENLFLDFNEIRLKLMKKGKNKLKARKCAWIKTKFEKRYRKKIMSNPKLVNKLKKIKRLSEKKDVYLYCYCGKPLCPRFILLDIINSM